MRLYLMRSGFASDTQGADGSAQSPASGPDQPLSREGLSVTRRVAQGLRRLEVSPDVILTSPIRRAVQTSEIAAEVFGLSAQQLHRTAALLAEQAPDELRQELARIEVDSVLCVGHAPHLDWVVADVCGRLDEPITSLRRGSVVCLEVEENLPVAWLVWLLEAPMLARLGE
ncbi:MAG: histidine phosphatase family protein [Planctomycetota bacterium]